MNTNTFAFINSTHTKTEAVALAEWHRQQDSYMQHTYGKDTPDGWRACSIGCMAKGNHEDYPKLFGIDARIAYLSDAIFEGLPAPDYKHFTVKLFSSIQEGIDTRLVWFRFTHWMLSDAEHGVVKFNNNPAVIAVIELFKRAAGGETITQGEWEAAADAAYTVYNDAYVSVGYTANAAAAKAAARAADAAAADDVDAAAADAKAATRAAARAAYAAADVAYASTRIENYKIMADKLCYFLAGGV